MCIGANRHQLSPGLHILDDGATTASTHRARASDDLACEDIGPLSSALNLVCTGCLSCSSRTHQLAMAKQKSKLVAAPQLNNSAIVSQLASPWLRTHLLGRMLSCHPQMTSFSGLPFRPSAVFRHSSTETGQGRTIVHGDDVSPLHLRTRPLTRVCP